MRLPCGGFSRDRSGRHLTIGLGVAVAVALVFVFGASRASAQFRETLDRLPRPPNAVVIPNLEKANSSAMGMREVEAAALKGQPKGGSMASQTLSAGDEVQVSLRYYQSITTFLNDLKVDLGNRKTMASTAFYADKYARKIERMPMLGVDPELLDYGAFVAQRLRQLSASVKNAGVQGGLAQRQVSLSSDYYNYGYNDGGYGYGRVGYWGGYGGYGTYALYDPYIDLRYEAAQRRVIRSQVRASTANATEDVRQDLIAATHGIRRKMTERYQVEF